MKLLLTAMVWCLLCAPADAQLRAKAKQNILKQKAKQQKQADAAIERFLAMSPEDRRQALAQLPPQRQRQILQRLSALELLSEEERTLLRGRLQAFSGMTAVRRQAVRAELRSLRAMSPEDRRHRLAGDEVQNNFSEEERQLLNDVFGRPAPQEE